MKRKDAVLVTVFVNAGLLLVLFISALTHVKDVPSYDMIAMEQKKNKAIQPLYKGKVKQEIKENEENEFISLVEKKETPQQSLPKETPKISFDTPPMEKKEIVHKLPEEQTEEKSKEKELPRFFEITVKKGDSLEKLSKIHRTTIAQLKKINQLENSFLRIGQGLLVPRRNEAFVSVSPPAIQESSQKKENEQYYIVKVGENPWTIAMKHRIKVEDLLRMNKLDEKKARRIRPGDKLRVR